MSLLAAARLPVLAALVLLAGCASPAVRSVQVVADQQDGMRPGLGSPEMVSPENLAPDDRLVIVRVGYANPLEFRHWLYVAQIPSASKPDGVIRSVDVALDGKSGERLLLLRFKAEVGDAAVIYPYACMSTQRLTCRVSAQLDPHLSVKLPPPGGAVYLGRVQFRIEDVFPHRGTQNRPQVKGLVVRDALDEDTAAAKQRWPVLNGRPIARSPARIRS
jgi:hypothetical protein